MEREEIDEIVCEIMLRDGPDGHVDGHDVITDFIIALQDGIADGWVEKYKSGGRAAIGVLLF